MDINSNLNFNNVNFGAKMDVSGIKSNKERWQNIAKIFEQKTQKYDDIFVLETEADYINPTKNYIYIDAQTTPESNDIYEHCAEIYDNDLNKILKEKSDEAIANKLVKLLKIFRHNDKQSIDANKFINKFMKNDKYNDQTNFETKFFDILVDKMFADIHKSIDEDETLSHFKVY